MRVSPGFSWSAYVLLFALACMQPHSAHAASLTWGASGTGGTGTWDAGATANWFNGSSAVVWPAISGSDDDAVFAGNAGTVSLAAGGISANDLTFNVTGYLLQGGTLTLNGVTPSVTTAPATSSTISSVITGSTGLTKSGAGTLILSAANTFTGNTTVNGGTLAVTGNGRLYSGAANTTAVVTVNSGATLELDTWWNADSESLGQLDYAAARMVVNGGTIRMKGITGHGRGFTINSGGATFEAAAGANWFLHDFSRVSAFVYNGNPTLTFTGAGTGYFWKPITGGCSVVKRGPGMWCLLGTNSNYTGNTTVEMGTLRIMRATLNDASTLVIQRGGIVDLWGDDTDAIGALVINGVNMPPGTYNRTTHPEYFIGRGSVVVGGPAVIGAQPLGYYLAGVPASVYGAIDSSMAGAMIYYNKFGTYGRFTGNIQVYYSGGIPTAHASQGGPIGFGGSISSRTAMHEMGHVMGVGSAWQWDSYRSNTSWIGQSALNLLKQIDGPNPYIYADSSHFGPYGLNFANEDSAKARMVHPMMVSALRKDMGIFNDPPTISAVANQNVIANWTSGPIAFTISDDSTAAASLRVTVHCSNPALFPDSQIALAGSGATRSVTLTPAAGQTGTATITLFVLDHENVTSRSFVVTVGAGTPPAYVWNGGTGAWNTSTPNWSGQGTLWPNSGNDAAGISGAPGTITLAPGISANSVTFNTSGFTVSGNTLSLTGATPSLAAQAGVTGTIGSVIAGSAGLVKNYPGTVVLTATNTYTGTTTINDGALQIGDGTTDGSIAASASIVVTGNGVLAPNLAAARTYAQPISGSGGVSKSGPGTLTFTGNNTFTGPTAVNAGVLVVSNAHASSSHMIASGAVLELNSASGSKNFGATSFTGSGTLRKTGANSITWPAGVATFALGSGGLIDVQGGTFVGGSFGNENWNANLADLNVAAGAVFDGVEANVRVDLITGTGTVRTGWSGSGYADFTIGVANGSGTISNVIADSGATGNLTKEGSGTITLSAANTFTGTTTISAGTLGVTGGAAIADVGAVVLASNTAVFDVQASETIFSLAAAAGNPDAETKLGSGAALTLSPTAGNNNYYGNITGPGGLTVNGNNSATVQFLGTGSTWSGPTTVNNGARFNILATGALSPATAVTVNSGGQLSYNSGNGDTIGNAFTISGNGDSSYGLGALRLADGVTLSGTIMLAGNSRLGVVDASATVSGRITGAFGLTFQARDNIVGGASVFTVSNPANDYTGATTVANADYNSGHNGSTTLRLGASNVLPNGAAKGNLALSGASATYQTILEMNGFSETINGLSNTAATGAIVQNSTGAATLTIGDNNATSTFSGPLRDNGGTLAISKIGTGTLTLTGANTYTGATTVSAGKLAVSGTFTSSITATTGKLAAQGAPGTTGNLAINSGGRFEVQLDGPTVGTEYDMITVGGTVTLAGALDILAAPGLATGTTFTIVNKTSAGAVSGTFAGKPQGSVFASGGYNWLISYTGGDGNDVTLTLATAQQSWRFTHFGTGLNTGTAADLFDANGDGELNLMEFATGQSPTAASQTTPALAKSGTTLEFTYTRSLTAMNDGATFTVEWSETLNDTDWSTSGVSAPLVLSDNGVTQQVKVTVPAGSGVMRRFVRLKVTR